MIQGKVSLFVVMDKIYRDIIVPTGTEWQDFVEWVCEALELLPSQDQQTLPGGKVEIDIVNSRGRLPNDLDRIDSVMHNGARLAYSSGRPPKNNNAFDTNSNYRQIYTTGSYWLPNQHYMATSFKTGKVFMSYYQIDIDENGFPYIPDHISIKECLTTYVDAKIGHKQWRLGDISLAMKDELDNLYINSYNNAKAHIIFPDNDKMEAIKNQWLRFRPRIAEYQSFFVNTGKQEYGNSSLGAFNIYGR